MMKLFLGATAALALMSSVAIADSVKTDFFTTPSAVISKDMSDAFKPDNDDLAGNCIVIGNMRFC
ncbi:MAG: hypothetical protein ACYTBS_12885 [Planctomycetota bacterium]|jgi:opacity protein-like surface antigen